MIQPGQTLTVPQLLPLTASGQVTLTAQAQFVRVVTLPSGVTEYTTDHAFFQGHCPAVQLAVAAQPPADRMILLQHVGPLAFVVAPSGARHHLLYLYSVTCKEGTGTMGTGNFRWDPLPTATAYDPGCPGTDERWSIAVGAPGYAIASARWAGRGWLP